MGGGQIEVVRDPRVAGGLHTELPRAVTAEEVAFDNAVFDDETRMRGDAFRVEPAAAEGARNMRLFAQVDEIGQDFLTDAVHQETALAVERAAAERARQMADQAARHRRVEQDGIGAGRNTAAVEAAHGAQGGGAADLFGCFQILMTAGGIVPVVAFHALFVGGDHAARNAVARTLLVRHKAVGIAVDVLVMSGLDIRPFGVFDTFVRIQRRLFALLCQCRRLFRTQIPFVITVEVNRFVRHQIRVGQTGAVVFGGIARDVDGRPDRIDQRLVRKVGGTGAALAPTGIDGDVQRFVLLELDLFDFAQAHAHALAERFAEIGFRRRCAVLLGKRECAAA